MPYLARIVVTTTVLALLPVVTPAQDLSHTLGLSGKRRLFPEPMLRRLLKPLTVH